MEVIEAIQYHFTSFVQTIEDLVNDMTFAMANDFLFMPAHFPFFFVFNALYVCFVIRKHNTRIQWWKSLLVSYFMVFSGRSLIAFLVKREIPILATPLYTPVFVLVWWFVNCSPEDFFYKIFDNKFSAFIMQLIFGLIQIRETTHGTKFGSRYFGNSLVTIILLGVILGSSDAAIYCLSGLHKTRNFSGTAMIRCLFFSIAAVLLTQYPEYFKDYFEEDLDAPFVNIMLLGLSYCMIILDDLLYGIFDHRMLGSGLVSVVSRVFTFHGDSVSEPR